MARVPVGRIIVTKRPGHELFKLLEPTVREHRRAHPRPIEDRVPLMRRDRLSSPLHQKELSDEAMGSLYIVLSPNFSEPRPHPMSAGHVALRLT